MESFYLREVRFLGGELVLREDTQINFVLYNVILTFGGWGFSDMTFSNFFLLCQNLESLNWPIRNYHFQIVTIQMQQ